MPNNYQIFDYWKDKNIDNQPILIDWGEPSCWACNKQILVETQELLDNGDFEEIWNRTSGHLQRCHIIPKGLGGSNEPENLFLLCPDCHKESPDTTNPKLFFDWIRMKRKRCSLGVDYVKAKQDMEYICKSSNVDIKDLLDFMEVHKNEFDISKIGTHGVKISMSSVLLTWIDMYKNSGVTI
jgi:hypothetical protein